MDEITREMDGTKKGIIGVAAFLLCIFSFMLPLVQYTQDSRIASTGWEIASSKSATISYDINELTTTNKEVSGYLTVDIPRERGINFLACGLLIIPIVVIIFVFTRASFTILRNVSFIGVIANIAFIIVVYARWRGYFIPTIFNLIILAIYIGLCAFSQKWNVKKTTLLIGGAAVIVLLISTAMWIVNSSENSPERVFQRFAKAVEKNDMKALANVTAPGSNIHEYAANLATENEKNKEVTETTDDDAVIVSITYKNVSVIYEKWYGITNEITETINSDVVIVSVIHKNNDTAIVSVTYKNGNEKEYDLIKVNGKWKVHNL